MKKKIWKTGIRLITIAAMLIPLSMNVGKVFAQGSDEPSTLPEITPENIQALELLHWFGEGAYTGDIAQQHDGSIFAAATTAGIKLLDKESGEQTAFIPIGSQPTALAISADDSMLAAVVNLRTGELVENVDGITYMQYKQQIQLYSLPDGESLRTFQDFGECEGSNIWAIAFTPDGSELVFERKYAGRDDAKRFCALASDGETKIRSIEVAQDGIMAISPNGEWAASISAEADAISLYDTQNFNLVKEIEIVRGGSTLLFSQDGQYIGLNSYDDNAEAIQIWDVQDGALVFSGGPSTTEDIVHAFDVDASGENLYLGTQNGHVETYSIASGEMIAQVTLFTWTRFSPIANPGGAIPAEEQPSTIKKVMLSQDEASLIVSDDLSAYGQTHIRVLAVSDLKENLDFNGPCVNSEEPAFAFSPDSSRIALVGEPEGKVAIYNVQNGERTMTLDGHTRVANQVSFSPDGEMIATGSDDNTIRLWDAQSGELLYTLEGHQARVNRLVFSPDSSWLVSGADDNTLRRWNAADGSLLETLELGNEHWRVDFLDILADNTSVVYRISKYPSPYIGYLTKQMIWDTSSGEQNTIGGSDIHITGLTMENDLFVGFTLSGGKRAVGTFQGDGSMRITATFQSPYGTGALSNETISPDKRLIVSGNGFGLHAWEYKEDALDFLGLVATQEAMPNYGMDYLFSPDGKYLVFTSGGVAYLLGVAEQ